jgi:protein-S-isoprenylcysteine O-methyltransferase Ste14
MNIAVTRALTWPRGRAGTRSFSLSRAFAGERVAKVLIVMLFSAMAMRIARDVAVTHHTTGLLLLVSEALVVVFTMIRRPAGTVDRTLNARILTIFSTFGPQFVRPASLHPLAPESLTLLMSASGLILCVVGKVSLGRSFGLTPANRGVVSTGLYQFVRHPIYMGYLLTHVGFVIANPIAWNFFILATADVALLFRAIREERTLALDPAYAAYMQRVRWRLAPGLF